MSYRTVIKKPFLSGTTPLIEFQIVDPDGVGYRPDTLLMSVYDYSVLEDVASQAIVNDRNDVDVRDACDEDGYVSLYLGADDTTIIPMPAVERALMPMRRILFAWTWDEDKVGKHEVILTIAPDRAPEAM